MKISIKSPSLGSIEAELTNENPKTAKAIYDLLPISGTASLWGEEIYFPIVHPGLGSGAQLAIAPEHPRTVVKAGEIAIWIEQPSFCIIFGKTPMSTDKEIKVYSECNVIGKIEGNPAIFKKVKEGEKILVGKVVQEEMEKNNLPIWLSRGL